MPIPEKIKNKILTVCKSEKSNFYNAVVVFGSSIRDDYHPGTSDINLLVITDDAESDSLRKIALCQRQLGKKYSILCVSSDFLSTSLDTYPLEILDFILNHEIVLGDYDFNALIISPHYLRIQLERELKGKVNLLRQSYINCCSDEKKLSQIVTRHFSALTAIFQGVLYYFEMEVPSTRKDILRMTANAFNFSPELGNELLIMAEKKRINLSIKFEQFYFELIAALERMAIQIDKAEEAE